MDISDRYQRSSDINQFGPSARLLAVGILGLFMILLAIPLLLNQPEDPLKKLQRSMVGKSTRDKKTKKERLRQAGAATSSCRNSQPSWNPRTRKNCRRWN